MSQQKLINLYDYEKAAREKLSPMFFDYYAGGADDEITLRENQLAFDRVFLRYRVLRGISKVDTSINLLGQRLRTPILIAPTGLQRLAHEEGEIATARAADSTGTVMILSTMSTSPMEDVLAATSSPVWFQLYMYRDREVTRALIARAQQAGCKAIVLTVDLPVLGNRERDARNSFQMPADIKLRNLTAAVGNHFPEVDGSSLAEYTHKKFKLDLSWKDLDWLCSTTDLPVLIKGVAHAEDAAIGLDYGISGIIVSNHGGRQLDTAAASIDLLPEIVEAVDARLPILIDGGIRRGTDVVKALALGAQAVGIGRPVLWGLAVDGASGVERVLNLLGQELERSMALCGAKSIDELTRDLVTS